MIDVAQMREWSHLRGMRRMVSSQVAFMSNEAQNKFKKECRKFPNECS